MNAGARRSRSRPTPFATTAMMPVTLRVAGALQPRLLVSFYNVWSSLVGTSIRMVTMAGSLLGCAFFVCALAVTAQQAP